MSKSIRMEGIVELVDFKEAISNHEIEKTKLRATLAEAHRLKDRSKIHDELFSSAAKRYREFTSIVDDLTNACLKDGIVTDPNLRKFVFDYIQCDPYFYRSGYILEKLLQRIKKLKLSTGEKNKIQVLILHRIETRALRNFRNICRLIPVISDDDFHQAVLDRYRSKDENVRRRAEFALCYFR
ncbi:hypothetical protein [Kiloniella antarctica]|uniref:Uncharacterized protein n=1 Tax=Kiloniella antarctica TaxID=1550907 RepID=A0ABW5BJK1_9PROT